MEREIKRMNTADYEELKKSESEEEPVDKYNTVYLIQLLYGMAILLPFNIIVSCTDFYDEKVSSAYSLQY